MLEPKKHVPFCCFPDFFARSSINDLARRCLKELVYLFLPEDTTDKAESLEASTIRNVIKMVFWIVMSIAISLTVGQLK